MKIFLSWSGPQSRAVAQALSDWLPRVIQAVRVFFSPDIEKGATWSNELDDALEGTSFGIVCLTQQNLMSPWIHYEAGALSKMREARVWTFLLDLTPGHVGQPLGRFQHTVSQREDVRKLVRTINGQLAAAGATPLGEQILEEIFDDSWPRLEARLQEARGMAMQEEGGATVATRVRSERAIFEEMLELLRDQQRRLNVVEGALWELGSGATQLIEKPHRTASVGTLDRGLKQLQERFPVVVVHPSAEVPTLVRGAQYLVRGPAREVTNFAASVSALPESEVITEANSETGLTVVNVVLRGPTAAHLVDVAVRHASTKFGVPIDAMRYLVDRP